MIDLGDRTEYFGGSDLAALMGCDQFRDGVVLWGQKKGQIPEADPVWQMLKGLHLEPLASDRYTEVTGHKPLICEGFTHRKYDFIRCHPDRIFYESGHLALIEIKCPHFRTFSQVQREGVKESWILQVQHNLMVTGYDLGEIVVFHPDFEDLIIAQVEPDRELHEIILDRELRFWESLKLDSPPAWLKGKGEKADIKLPELKSESKFLRLDNDRVWEKAVDDYREAKALHEETAEIKNEAQKRMLALMGDNEICEGGGVRVYHRTQNGRTCFDWRKLMKHHTDIDYTPYIHQGRPFDSVRVYEL